MRSSLLFSFFFAWLLTSQVNAQDSTVTQYLTEVTFAANRWEQDIIKVPSRVDFISKDGVSFYNVQTSADLLSLSNHVFLQKSQLGGGSPMIRGFAANRVMLVMDGIRLNNAIFRSGNLQNVISLDANVVHSAEIVFGPGSVMYGSDALGGVMDFHTISPQFANDSSLLVNGDGAMRYSSANNERMMHVDINVGSRWLSMVSAVTRSMYDDLRMGSKGPDEYKRNEYVMFVSGKDSVIHNRRPNIQNPSGFNQWNILQKFAVKATDFTTLTYGFHFSSTSEYSRYDRLILKNADGTYPNAEWYYGPQRWELHSLKVAFRRSRSLYDHAKVIAAFQDYQESRHNRNFNSIWRNNRSEKVKVVSINLDFEKEISNEISLQYGAEGLSNKVFSRAERVNIYTGETTPLSTRYPDGADWQSAGFYAAIKIQPHEAWSLNLSGRFTRVYAYAKFDTTFFDFPFSEVTNLNNAVNGSIGLAYNPDKDSKLYINLSNGFRAPNIDDLGKVFESEPGSVIVPNPELKPENAYSAEVGGIAVVNEAVVVEGAAYYSRINNAIARGTYQFNGMDTIVYDEMRSSVLALQNIRKLWTTGLELGLTFNILTSLDLRLNYNLQHGQAEDQDSESETRPTHIPPMFGSAHLLFQRKKLKFDLYGNFNGSVRFEQLPPSERADAHLYATNKEGNPYSPAWWTLNLKSSYRTSDMLRFDIGLENIFDKRYRPYSSGIAAPGRNFIIAAKVNF